jgi:uncharacterized protein YprB with RNaseH-like and TPR domain
MLKNTFIHLPHIGRVTEQRLWQNDIITWQDLLKETNDYAKRFSHIKHLINLSKQKLKKRDVRFFTDRLVSDQQWRIFPDFHSETVYIDIETTGLGSIGDHITTISLYDGKNIFYYVYGKNLNQFKNDIKKYSVLVTYNGKTFDVPFIEREFGIKLHHSHIDLRYVLRSLGIKGGLKSCEHQLGMTRGDLEGMDGYFAVLLWKDYLDGNRKALDTLLAYNIEDTINLEKLMIYALEKKLEKILLDNKYIYNSKPQEIRKPKKIPFQPDISTIRKIKKKYY